MAKKKFCCEASRQMYEDYYKRQTGGEMPVFVGRRHQRCHGLRSILGNLFRGVVPFIKRNIGTVGRTLARTGIDVAGDVLRGRNVKEAVKRRVPQGLKRTAANLDLGPVGSQLVRTGANIASDIISGKKFKEAVKQRGQEGIKRTVQTVRRQKGSGRRRRIIRRRRSSDIFD